MESHSALARLQSARRAAEDKFHEKNDEVIGLQNEVHIVFIKPPPPPP
jgi:hypothetical protein